MASENSNPASQQPANTQNPSGARSHTPAPASSSPENAPAPPSKRDLISWWRQFKKNTKKGEETASQPSEIFGVPLNVSIKYANVAISLTGEDGKRFIYGYVPIVVAKCGVFLKEKATDVEGIFRLSGSAKRIKDLQEIFDTPDRYGKGLDWSGYTVHDAANVLRRYLNLLPEPIIPFDFYERFREPLRHFRDRKGGSDDEAAVAVKDPPYDHDQVVATYQRLIKELPPLNRQLLLYILDLLTVFAAKSDINRMTAANLAAIFQPGLLSHPDHYMSPQDYKLSQDVLVFLIENQDSFLFEMTRTDADEQTVREFESGMVSHPVAGLRRSASNASAGADSLRKYEVALRRNASVSSKHSRNSAGNGSPSASGTIRSPTIGGVHRSNTVPAKRPTGLSPKIHQPSELENAAFPPGAHQQPHSSKSSSRTPSRAPSIKIPQRTGSPLPRASQSTTSADQDVMPTAFMQQDQSRATAPESTGSQMLASTSAFPQPALTPTKERKRSSLFGWVSPPEDGRQPNRLRKKRLPTSSTSESAHSSTYSLPPGPDDALPGATASQSKLGPVDSVQPYTSTPQVLDTIPDKEKEEQTQPASEANQTTQMQGDNFVKPERSQSHTSSVRSRSSLADISDADRLDEGDKKEKRRSWRFRRTSPSSRDQTPASVSSNSRGEASHSLLGSATVSQENISGELQRTNKDSLNNFGSVLTLQESDLSSVAPSSVPSPRDEGENKKGFFGKFKAKVTQVKEDLKEGVREEIQRSKSPPHPDGEKSSSRTSLSIFASRDSRSTRGLSSENLPEQRSRDDQEQCPTAATPVPATITSTTPAIPEEETPEEKPVTTAPAHSEPAATGTVLTTVQEDVPLTVPPPSETVATTAPPPQSETSVSSTDKLGDATKESATSSS
ncbi:hypothetical protein VTO42DRAFT_7133 [Malbranchea cinnamomea]